MQMKIGFSVLFENK